MIRKSPALQRLRNIAAGYAEVPADSNATVSVSDPDYKLLCSYAAREAKGVETVAYGRAHLVPASEFVSLVNDASEKPDAPPKKKAAAKETSTAKPKGSTGSASASPKKAAKPTK